MVPARAGMSPPPSLWLVLGGFVVPARAGMSPPPQTLILSSDGGPRASGDEPAILDGARDWVVVVPARAGMSPLFWWLLALSSGGPRASGDEPTTVL